MRFCGICKKPPRRDDPLTLTQTNTEPTAPAGQFMVSMFGTMPSGTLTSLACEECAARLEERRPPHPRQYPVGQVPTVYGERGPYLQLVCGVCRQAMREDDEGTAMRLHEDDFAAAELYCALLPGVYQSCRDCVALFRPYIYQRMLRRPELHSQPGHQPQLLPAYEAFDGDWLL